MEGPGSGILEARAVQIIDAQVRPVVRDDTEHDALPIEPRASEHSPRGNSGQSRELVENELEEFIADSHVTFTPEI